MTILPITDAIASLVSYNGSVGEYAIFNYGDDKYICLGAFKEPEEGKLTPANLEQIANNSDVYFGKNSGFIVDKNDTFSLSSEFVPTHYMDNSHPITRLLGNINHWYFQKI